MAVDVVCTAGHSFRIEGNGAEKTTRCPHCGHPTLAAHLATTVVGGDRTVVPLHASPAQTSSSSRSLQRLGRFDVLAVLGAGAFGTVYRAYDTTLKRQVALKVPRTSLVHDNEARQRFLREAEAAARLWHPHIVPIFDVGCEGETFYISSAYIQGETLESILRRERPDLRRSALLVRKLADALAYAASQGIVHRDVKPSNILVDHSGEPHLTDFGLARIEESAEVLTHDGALMGTPAYMSPEQAGASVGPVSAASDQYSLGVVLYELLCGQRPFQGPPVVLIYEIREKPPAPPRSIEPTIPRDLETICLKCLAKSPDQRYANCRALVDELDRWLRGDAIQARRISHIERLGRWARRNPAVAGLCALAAALLVCIVGVQHYGNRELSASREQIRLALDNAERATNEARAQTKRAEDFGRRQSEALQQLRREETARRQAEAAAAEAARQQSEAEKEAAALELSRAQAVQQADTQAAARTQAEQRAAQEEQARLRAESQARGALSAGRLLGYIDQINEARQALGNGDKDQARGYLEASAQDLRSWEWAFLWRLATVDQPPASSGAHSGGAGAPDLALSADGAHGVLLSQKQVVVFDARTLRDVATFAIHRPSEAIVDIAAGRVLIRSALRIIVGDFDTQRTTPALLPDRLPAWSFMNTRVEPIIAARRGDTFTAFAVDLKTRLGTFSGLSGETTVLAVSPDMRRIAVIVERGPSDSNQSADERGLWIIERDANRRTKLDPRRIAQFNLSASGLFKQPRGFNPAGDRFALLVNSTAYVWNADSGELPADEDEDPSWLASIGDGKISLDGRRLIEKTKLVDLRSGQLLLTLQTTDLPGDPAAYQGRIVDARFSVDGRRLYVARLDGSIVALEADFDALLPPNEN